MSQLIINFIGCGRLGKTVAKLIKLKNLAMICGIVNRSKESAQQAVEFIGAGTAYSSIKELPKADIYFITTSDDAIQPSCSELAASGLLNHDTIVLHCSGSLTSDVLESAKNLGSHTASIHPIKSFASPECIDQFKDAYCAIEGDDSALSELIPIFEKMGGIVFRIHKEKKQYAHIAGVIANNYLVTLHHCALQCYEVAGVDEKIAKKIVSMLMTDALNNINLFSYEKALTGPIQRGDTETIDNHIMALSQTNLVKNIYSALGIETLSLTHHSETKKEELKKILTGL